MSGVHGQILGHVVKRSADVARAHFFSGPVPERTAQLQADAELYEKMGQEIDPMELLPVIITAVLTLLLVGSIKYTIGEVMASLAMIESPTSTAIIEDAPPAYADEPDAPLEKEPLMPAEAQADVEVTLIPNKPITAKISTTIRHLQRVGGFRARWRGAGVSIVYHLLHSMIVNLFGGLLGFGLFGGALSYVFVSVGLSRVHMAWTHAMVAQPSTKPFWRRMVPRKQCKAILLPSLAFALAQQATVILPIIVAFALHLHELDHEQVVAAAHHKDCHKLLSIGLRLLAVPATAIFIAFAVLLPATVTLTRIEALLLPEDQDTIVPFDRQAIVGDIDLSARGSSKALFISAWRSFDRAARWRLIKLYVKMVMVQVGVIFISMHLMIAEIYLIGGERLGYFFKSAIAQLKLAAIDAHEKQN